MTPRGSTKPGRSTRLCCHAPPGRHEFKFPVDGASCREPGCDGHYQGRPQGTPNPHGPMNRVLEVEA